jgi:hypothetical protein
MPELSLKRGADSGVKSRRSDDFQATRNSERSAMRGLLPLGVRDVMPKVVGLLPVPWGVSVTSTAIVGVMKELKHAISPYVPQNPLPSNQSVRIILQGSTHVGQQCATVSPLVDTVVAKTVWS